MLDVQVKLGDYDPDAVGNSPLVITRTCVCSICRHTCSWLVPMYPGDKFDGVVTPPYWADQERIDEYSRNWTWLGGQLICPAHRIEVHDDQKLKQGD